MKIVKYVLTLTMLMLGSLVIQPGKENTVVSKKVQAVYKVGFYELYLLRQRGLPETMLEFVAAEAELEKQWFNSWFKAIYQEGDSEEVIEELQQPEKKLSRFRRLKNRLFL